MNNNARGINSEAAQKILDADLTNIVRKVKAGKPLNARERNTVQAAAEVRLEAKTQTELRAIVGITKTRFYTLKKKKGSPAGLDIKEWRTFIASINADALSDKVLTPEQIANLRGQLLAERAAKEKIARKLKELKYERESGSWITLAEAKELVSRNLEPVNRLLDGIPKKYAMRINPSDADHAEVELREMVIDLKEQLVASRGAKISTRKGGKGWKSRR